MIMTWWRRILIVLIGAWIPVLIVYLWWTSSAGSINPYFPPLSLIMDRFTELWFSHEFVTTVLPSLRNFLLGYALACIIGICLGTLIGGSQTGIRYAEPIIDFIRSIPAVATVPIFIVIFGLDIAMRVASITVAATMPILIATIQGVRSADVVQVETSRVLHLSRSRQLWRVRLPGAMPLIFSGLQLGLQIAFIVTIASEFLGSGFGIGSFTLIATESFLILDAWTGVILMGLLGYVINIAFDVVERFVLRWYYGQKKIA
ncbi:MAG: ABC transporter permease [Candidatus Nanopelagicales bacterium]|jgi:sulfonate transport system permease protein